MAETIRILGCPRLNRQGACARHRLMQYIPYLHGEGFEVEVAPLLDDEYLRVRYRTGGRSPLHAARAYVRRIGKVWRRSRYDLLWVHKEVLPWIPRWLERLAFPPRVPYVVDFDDAEFHRYDAHHSRAVRALLGRKIDGVMRDAVLVVAGNSYIADRARQAGAARVEMLPTVVDLAHYPVSPPPVNEVFTIGWIGTPITAQFLHWLQPALREICRRGPARLVAIGAGPLELEGVPVEVRPWSEATEVRDMQDFDVGIMPLCDTPGTRGKCGLKLIQYMACVLPVVGTPVGVNREIIEHGRNGFHAETKEDWVEAVETLRRDPALRQHMGQAGRNIVEDRYSLAVAAPKFARLLREAASAC
jgi:glycosyltransferase involved in cell wall biosynthesis